MSVCVREPVSYRLADDCPRVLPPQAVDFYAEATALNGRKVNIDRLPGPRNVGCDAALDKGSPRSYLLDIWSRVEGLGFWCLGFKGARGLHCNGVGFRV